MSITLRTENNYGELKVSLSIKFDYLVSNERLDELYTLVNSVLDCSVPFVQDIRQLYDILGQIEKKIEEYKEEELKDLPESFRPRIVTYEYSYLKAKFYVGGELKRIITVAPE